MNESSFGGFAGIVFDAYGTLFDVSALETACAPHVDDPAGFTQIWRQKQIEYSYLRTIMDHYADFGQITSDALEYATATYRVVLDPTVRAALMRAWLTLPPFPEVPLAIDKLESHRYRMVILSNGTQQMLDPLLTQGGIREAFIDILTSERVQCFKPDPSIYDLVSTRIYARLNEILYVTANGFDIAGAKSAGFTVCRIDRYGLPLDLLDFEPDIVAHDLLELVNLLSNNGS